MAKYGLFFTLILASTVVITGCQSKSTASEATAKTLNTDDQFEDKPSPHIIDPQSLISAPIDKNSYSSEGQSQPIDLPATAAVNEYQQAYYTIIKPQNSHTHNIQNASAQAQFEYLPINPDVIFIKAILRHFQDTIALSHIEQQYGKDPTLLRLADDIISSRQNETQLMQNWLAMQMIKNTSDPNQKMSDSVAAQQEIDSINHDLQQEMVNTVMTKNADRAFAETILIHHKGGIALGQVVLKYGNDEKVKNLTNTMMDIQQAEIILLQNWLKANATS